MLTMKEKDIIKNIQLGEIYSKIIGFKGIVYNINDTSVKMET